MADQQKKPLKKETFFSPSPKSHISLDFAAKRVIQHPPEKLRTRLDSTADLKYYTRLFFCFKATDILLIIKLMKLNIETASLNLYLSIFDLIHCSLTAEIKHISAIISKLSGLKLIEQSLLNCGYF